MARPEPGQVLVKLASDLEVRRQEYVDDLALLLDKHPEKLTGKAAAGLNGRYRECGEILEMVRDGLKRLA